MYIYTQISNDTKDNGKKKLLTNIDNIKFICYMAFRLYFLLDLRKNITKEGDPYENIFIGG